MNKSIQILLCILPLIGISQKFNVVENSQNFGSPSMTDQVYAPGNVFVSINENTAEALKGEVRLPEGFTLRFKKMYESLTAYHYRYQLQYNEIDVFMGTYHLMVDKSSNQLKRINHSSFPLQVEPSVETRLSIPEGAVAANESLLKEKDIYFLYNNRLVLAKYVEVSDENRAHTQRIFSGNNWLYQKDLHVYHHAEGPNDTLLPARVFNPDPLTTSMNVYGAPYVDNNDQSVPELEAERQLKQVTLTKSLLGLSLENDALFLEDFAAPFSGVTSGSSASFEFTRDENGFEDMNVLYHMHEQYKHLQNLGFANYPGYQIRVDPHGANGADNSFFDYSSAPFSIEFGEGGVDDAEDADVIVHEYNHALSESFNGLNFISTERQNIEEGLADYFCTSYSKAINPFNASNVFTWDGHNEYWSGRQGVSNKQYPNLTFNGIYEHTDMLVSCLVEIFDSLGRNTTDQIIWEAMFSLNGNTTMPQFAQFTLDADAALNNGVNYKVIRDAFVRYAILPSTFSLEENTQEPLAKLYAQHAFGKGENALFEMDKPGRLTLMSINGALLKTIDYPNANEVLEISGQGFTPGIYFLQVTKGREQQTFKLLKF